MRIDKDFASYTHRRSFYVCVPIFPPWCRIPILDYLRYGRVRCGGDVYDLLWSGWWGRIDIGRRRKSREGRGYRIRLLSV